MTQHINEETSITPAQAQPAFPVTQYGLGESGLTLQAVLAPGLVVTFVVDAPAMNAIAGKWLEMQREKHIAEAEAQRAAHDGTVDAEPTHINRHKK